MKSGGPWNLRGLRPQTVEAAREAARRSGRSLGEWLNDLIEEHDDYRRAAMAPADDEEVGDYGRAAGLAREELGEIHDRLDRLTGQLERLARGAAPLRGAPMRPPQGPWNRNWHRNSDRGRRQSGGFTAGDAFVDPEDSRAEPAHDSDLPSPAIVPRAAGEPSERTADFPDLEGQLRRITAQIEALRPSTEIDKIIAGFRNDLSEIRHQLTEALPRQAVESLCAEVEALARRIDHSRESTVDADAIAGIERGLAEVRDALHRMTTAEKLVGFDEALKTLAQKLDLIIAKEDPAALEQLETAIGALRGVVSHVASNDALGKVAEDVRALSAKIDGLAKGAASGHAVSALGTRIDTLADALNASAAAGQAVPRELEKLLSGVVEKLEAVRLAAADPSALKRLEERIAQLISRLDASDAQLNNLAAIERSLGELLARMKPPHGDETTAAGPVSRTTAVAAIAADVAEIRRSERRTQDSLEAVHGTVEQVVGRLAMIESDIHDAAMRAPRSQAPSRAPSATSSPADKPAMPATALASAKPVAAVDLADKQEPAHKQDLTDKQDFIAAARRATQAAAVAPRDDAIRSGSRRRRRRSRASAMSQSDENRPTRLRKLLVAGAIVLFTVSCLQIALHIFQDTQPGPGGPLWQHPSPPASIPENNSITSPPRAAPQPSQQPTVPPAAADPPAPVPGPDRESDAPASTRSRDLQSPLPETPGAANPDVAVPSAAPRPSPPPAEQPTTTNPSEPTGSLVRPAPVMIAPLPPPLDTNTATANAPAFEALDILPPALGGAALRAAAIAGDAAAQFEIGIRFADGRGVPPNERQAAHWLELAAKQGLAPAQFRLGGYYEKGIGVKKDLAAARDLYLAAAAKGNGKAMHNLAVLYAEGINGRSDYRTAVLWFRKAADRGITDSQYNLGVLYARGTGTAQNYAEAYKWFARAANQGDVEAARKRDEMASQLDDDTLAAADLAVKNWRPEPQPDDAIKVRPPPGGWDTSTPAKPKPRTKNAELTAADPRIN
jgi:localization factor PodJL